MLSVSGDCNPRIPVVIVYRSLACASPSASYFSVGQAHLVGLGGMVAGFGFWQIVYRSFAMPVAYAAYRSSGQAHLVVLVL